MQSSVQQKSFGTQNVVQTDGQEKSRNRTPMFALSASNSLLRRICQTFWEHSLHFSVCPKIVRATQTPQGKDQHETELGLAFTVA